MLTKIIALSLSTERWTLNISIINSIYRINKHTNRLHNWIYTDRWKITKEQKTDEWNNWRIIFYWRDRVMNKTRKTSENESFWQKNLIQLTIVSMVSIDQWYYPRIQQWIQMKNNDFWLGHGFVWLQFSSTRKQWTTI